MSEMSEAVSCLIWLRDSALAALALGPWPAWAWTLDGTQILWANPQGAAIFGASAPSELTNAFTRSKSSDMTAQVARLALPADGSHRIERLQGFGTGIERTLSCRCARIMLADGADAILIAAAESAGPELSLTEKVAYWLADTEAPVAAFAVDGTLIHATAAAQARLAGARTLAALGAEVLRAKALGAEAFGAEALTAQADGHAAGETAAGKLAIDRLGPVLFATFEDAAPAPAERHQPLRFVWQIDADGRFTLDSEEFAALTGAHAVLGRSWQVLSASLGLDPDDQIAHALATRDTFSGLTIGWPVDDDGTRLAVEMSGLPVFDRERRFRGYRGFGICRELARLNALAQRAAVHVPPSATATQLEPQSSARETTTDPGSDADCREEVAATADEPEAAPSATARAIGPLLDRLPVGILIYRLNDLIYANRLFLRWTGYASVAALARAGGIESLLIGSGAVEPGEAPFTITSSQGESVPVAGRLFSVPWEGDKAFALITTPATSTAVAAPLDESSALADAQAEIAELRTIMDMTGDAIVVLDGELRIASSNRRADVLFGADTLIGAPFAGLLTPASAELALAQIAKLGTTLNESAAPDAIEITGRTRAGRLLGLSARFAWLGPDRPCAVLRDLTPWQKSEAELVAARRQAEQQSSAKSEFLAKVSHEIRNPLNAIIGFSELMMEERFGAIGNDRYRQYLKDIHASGEHIMSLVNDLIDLSKIESGRLELAFAGVALNELVEQCVALMQPQANREGVIVRTSLAARLPEVTADARSLRQVVLNLVGSAIKLGGAGGQVIVSTARAENGAVILRVRNTGIGISEDEVAAVLEPLRQTPTRSSGAGIGLPLAKALAEANGASLRIDSAAGSGTLIEVTFPRERTAE
jgi:signal transduction histidine kinase